MKVKIKLDNKAISKIMSNQEKSAILTALEMRNRIIADQRIPFDTGHTQNESTYIEDSDISKGHVYIITDNPYAKRIYFDPSMNFRTTHNANAGGEWWEDYITGSKSKEPKSIYQAILKKMMSGGLK